jgi:hypothetical protein
VPGEKRSKAQRLKDRETIARLRLRCRTLQQIADETGLSHATVKREMRLIEAEWREAAREDIATVKARELQKLDDLEAEARAEWERSKLDWQKRVVEDKPVGTRGGGGRAAKVETGGQCGDPRYLNVLLSIQERRAKILGSDAPTKIAPTNPDGTELLSKEHRDAIVAAALGAAGSDP